MQLSSQPNVCCVRMTTDLDIYRSAKLLIDQHGEDAARHAAMRAGALLEGGDMEGCPVSHLLEPHIRLNVR